MDNKSFVITLNCNILLFVVLLLLPVVVSGWDGTGRELETFENQHFEFDLQIFVLQWVPKVTSSFFTIHGLWPEYSNGTFPYECPGGGYNMQVMSELYDQMTKVWPSNNGRNTRFWKHEWVAHGTCSNMEQLAYFKTALNFHGKFDVKAALAKSGIVPHPSRTYDVSQIKQAITTNLGSNPLVRCSPRNKSALVEIGICFDATAENQIDCPDFSPIYKKINDYFYLCQPNIAFPITGDYASDSEYPIGPTPEDRPKVIVFLVIAACCIVLVLLAQKFATRYYMRNSKDYVEKE